MEFPYHIIDLTHTITSTSPAWNLDCGFKHRFMHDYDDNEGDVKFRVNHVSFPAGMGTHMDAPAHVIKGGMTIDQIPLQHCIKHGVCIDVSSKADANYCVTPDDILKYEQTHGRIARDSVVIVYTGWDRFWDQPAKYHNDYQFPSLCGNAAELLLARDIAGVGIDTLSPDCPDSGFPVHQHLLQAGKYIVENVANAAQLPPCGAWILTFPLKMAGLTESPIRAAALIEK